MNVETESFRFCIVFFILFSSFRITSTATTVFDRITLEQSIRDGETVVSAEERFELGFFSPGISTRRYLGIWYKNINPLTSVWVANRDSPLSDRSGILRLNPEGTLELLNSTNGIIWSSNVSTVPHSPVAMLLKSGNLVVRDESDSKQDNFLWQSFDYVGNTLLPGMKLGVNLETGHKWFLSSWKSMDDPSEGEFTQAIYPQGVPQLCLKKGNETILRAGSWNGLTWSGVSGMKPNPVYNYTFVSNEKEVSYMYQVRDGSIMRTMIDPSGRTQRFTWVNQTNAWVSYFGKSRDECDAYAKCSAYAICNIIDYPPCTCFPGFVPKLARQWSEFNWSDGCVRRNKLGCDHGDGFLKLESVKLPDTRHSWSDRNIDVEQCEKLCLKNCSCTGYANLDVRDGGSGCLLWFNELIDVKKIFEGGGQDFYVRVAASELGNAERRRQSREKKNWIIIVVSLLSAFGLLVLFWIIYMRTMKHKKMNKGNTNDKHELDDNGEGSENEEIGVTTYDLKTITDATDNFSDKMKLGEGGFGLVYKGILSDGQEIAIKRLSKSSGQGIKEFKNEVILIAELQHRNLVKLLGCCVDRGERMLIYEYMPNKSLNFFIFDKMRRKVLDWSMCMQIITGTARGLLYLHQDSRLRIIHRDLKASNVLLDHKMQPKISDFGLARIFEGDQIKAETNKVVGTYGYMPPEYAIDGIFSLKSDVFSLGVLVLEMISGKRNRGFSHTDHNLNLLGHAWKLWNEEKALELIDETLDYSSDTNEMLRCIHVGLLCVQQKPEDRPDISTVVVWLGGEGLLPDPNQPGFFTERNLPEWNSSPSKEQVSSTNELSVSLLEAR